SLLGEVQVEVPDVLEPGETFDVLVHCVPKRALKLNSLKLALVGQEVVVRGSGTDRTTYRHKVHEEALELDPGRQLKAGEHEVFACSLTLPDDAGPSFAASDNALRWEVALQFDIPRWPDWIKSWQLAVRPRRS
ncbi:MAG: hypothetical protein KC656_27270, partial [Myxococcales bacterium]|nr:hypothetical protein [Myxococcales bacterium]